MVAEWRQAMNEQLVIASRFKNPETKKHSLTIFIVFAPDGV